MSTIFSVLVGACVWRGISYFDFFPLTGSYSPAIQKYEALIQEKYKEPIDGKFEDITDVVLRDSAQEDSGSEMELELGSSRLDFNLRENHNKEMRAFNLAFWTPLANIAKLF